MNGMNIMDRKEQAVCLPGSSEIYGKKTRRKGELMIEIKRKRHDCGKGRQYIILFGDDEVLEIEEARMGDPDTNLDCLLGRLVDRAC